MVKWLGLYLCLWPLLLWAESAPHPSGTHWGYAEYNGPAQWANLSKEYALCAQGQAQSPIDLAAAYHQEPSLLPPAPLPPLEFLYQPAALNLSNNGHTLQQEFPPGSAVIALGKRFELVQVHFHAPSEHRLRGESYPIEAHLVHRAADGELAVVGIFIRRGSINPALQALWLDPPQVGQSRQQPDLVLSPMDLLPRNRSYYFYLGSLTTPPCSEGVRWFVLRKPLTASDSQINRFFSLYTHHARPVQPLNQRRVMEAFQPTLPLRGFGAGPP